jgi:hypothetical protein
MTSSSSFFSSLISSFRSCITTTFENFAAESTFVSSFVTGTYFGASAICSLLTISVGLVSTCCAFSLTTFIY